MPTIALPDTFTRPEHLIEYIADLFEKAEELPFEFIGKYEDTLFPRYPACLIQPGRFENTLHGTHTFLVTLRMQIFVMHCDLTKNKKTRSLEDCQFATKVIEVLEADLTLERHVIHSHVETDLFAPLPPRSRQSAAVISTLLTWQGISERRFK